MSDAKECCIKVVCRIRPPSDKEKSEGGGIVLSSAGEDSVSLGGKTFNFDRVVPPDANQDYVYNVAARSIVNEVLNGYNGTIFAYGQTGSGKTYTMEGVVGDCLYEGIIPRIIKDIFNHIYSLPEAENVEFHIKCTYLEIYLDKIRDLLDVSKTQLTVHEDKQRVPYVKGATERFVSSVEEVLALIDEGKANRHVAVTNMNEHSSRSHCVFLIQVKQQNTEKGTALTGKLYLVDLAGSEKVSKTGAEGSTLDEAKNINRSLSALGNVINALVEGNVHVPYRDSKLTRILQESLGGNARTTIVICCSPAAYNEPETRSTLLFGTRAKTIKNTVSVNEELTAEEWRRRFERERDKAARLQTMLQKLQAELNRWRGGERVGETEQVSLLAAASEEGLTSASSSNSLLELASLVGSPSGSSANLSQFGAAAKAVSPPANWEDEKRALEKQIDDKDDEIALLSQRFAQLQSQMLDQQEFGSHNKREFELLQEENMRLQNDCESSKEEVKEVLNALEELALNFDQKLLELQSAKTEQEVTAAELSSILVKLKELEREHARQHDISALEKRRHAELIHSLLRDVADLVGTLPSPLSAASGDTSSQSSTAEDFKNLLNTILVPSHVADGENAKAGESSSPTSIFDAEENWAVIRLHLSKARAEVRATAHKLQLLEDSQRESSAKVSDLMRQIDENRLSIQQHEARISTLLENERLLESKKRALETQLDVANEQMATLRSQLKVLQTEHSERSESAEKHLQEVQSEKADQLRQLESQLDEQRDYHSKQMLSLRDELAEQNSALSASRDELQRTRLAQERASSELERMRSELAEKSLQLERQALLLQQHQQSRRDLLGLEDAVKKELCNLNHVRSMFTSDLKQRLKKANTKSDQLPGAATENGDGDSASVAALGGVVNAAQQQKMQFLENNLEQLTKVHKQLVHDNSDLRLEIPKLEKRLRATVDRVKALEQALRDAKESAMRDRKHYQLEVERIKDAVRERDRTLGVGMGGAAGVGAGAAGGARRLHVPQIAKPIRPGQMPPSMPSTSSTLPPNLITGAAPIRGATLNSSQA